MKKHKLLFLGSKPAGLSVFKTLATIFKPEDLVCAALDDSQDSRSVMTDFKKAASQFGIEYYLIKGNKDLHQVIVRVQPKIAFVSGWYLLLNSEILNMLPMGWYGYHPSLLPQYRGFAPLVWAMINGETKTGVTLFEITKGMDTGRIAARRTFNIAPDEQISDILVKYSTACVELTAEYATQLFHDSLKLEGQDHSMATYGAMRRPEDGQVDWKWPAKQVHNFIRALSRPYPGAFGSWFGRKGQGKLHLWQSELFSYPYFGTPGLVAEIQDKGAVICCGQGAIIVKSIQFNDMDEVPAQELLTLGDRIR